MFSETDWKDAINMKILWITNIELPQIAKYYGRTVFREGWLDQTSTLLSEQGDIELHVLSMCDESYREIETDNKFYSSYRENNVVDPLKALLHEIRPDVIHIWGTENRHCYDAIKYISDNGYIDRTVISIQGLVSECAKVFCDGIPQNIVNGRTLFECVKRENIRDGACIFQERGKYEIEALRTAKYCIGRTKWDHQKVMEINPEIKYFKCNEILRAPFYSGKWDINDCNAETVSYSQTHYALKGFHYMVEALKDIRKDYPHVKLRAIGESPFDKRTVKDRIKESSYLKYIKNLIRKYELENCIEWAGFLTADEMREHYLKSNVFVCASALENSSNSVGEAMLLGVPVVASDVGGMRSILQDGRDGILFEKGDVKALVSKVEAIFADSGKAVRLGESARSRAMEIYDKDANIKALIKIYQVMAG